MKNLSNLIKKYEKIYAKKYCQLDDISLCTKKFCSCARAAEIKAYLEGIIPNDFSQYSINDFTGIKDGKMVLEIETVKKVKKQIIHYCWGTEGIERYNFHDENFEKAFSNRIELDCLSVIEKRKEKGNNVIIFGRSNYQIGKTLIAAIIMKEVILQRAKPEKYIETYDWIDFNILKNDIIKDTYDMIDYKSCDWLVVDDINYPLYASNEQRAYIVEMIDPFFSYRLRNKLPTIFVFRFDLNENFFKNRVETLLGIAIFDILKSKNTFKIFLE